MSEESNKNDNKTTEYLDPETKKFKEGNPGGGRPKGAGISITTEIKKKLGEIPEGQKATYLQLLINRIMKQAIQDGDQQMITKIWNYVDGMPKQPLEHSGEIDTILRVELTKINENNTTPETIGNDGGQPQIPSN